MHPSHNFFHAIRAFFGTLGLVLPCALWLAGCAPVPVRPAEPAPPEQTWSGPREFSADYLWNPSRATVAYDRPVKLVRLVVRQGRAVRAVGIDVFGATLVDELIRSDAQGKIHTRFRQGADNVDGLLLEQTLRRVFFNDPAAARVRWLKNEAGADGAPASELGLQIDGDAVEMQLTGATAAPQADADFDYPAAP
jgi:hypothetical protein